ncbi:hypothetical protein BLOT_002943 [Blomia tropicalis]|nr:hypothetical protein BLOT_002943 [Blomia tropicalis]
MHRSGQFNRAHEYDKQTSSFTMKRENKTKQNKSSIYKNSRIVGGRGGGNENAFDVTLNENDK